MPVDTWTLRCLYNTSDYDSRIAAGTLVELLRWQSKPRANGSRTVQVYYGLEGDGLFVTLQWFEGEHGEILRSGMKDPKQLYSPEVPADYHPHGGNQWWERIRRNPEYLVGANNDEATTTGRLAIKIQRAYGAWRRYKCCRWGAVEARRSVSRVLRREARA